MALAEGQDASYQCHRGLELPRVDERSVVMVLLDAVAPPPRPGSVSGDEKTWVWLTPREAYVRVCDAHMDKGGVGGRGQGRGFYALLCPVLWRGVSGWSILITINIMRCSVSIFHHDHHGKVSGVYDGTVNPRETNPK